MTASVVVDRWDLEDLALVDGLELFVRARRRVCRDVGDVGGDLLDDLFFVLLKGHPQVVDEGPDTHAINRMVIAEAAEVPAVKRLRAETCGDVFGAACAAARFAPALTAFLLRVETPAWLRAVESGDELMVDAVRAAVDQVFGVAVDEFRAGIDESVGELDARSRAAGAWGLERGDLRRLDFTGRERLVAVLDTVHVRLVADLFGRLRATAFAAPVDGDDGWGEIEDLEHGGDLARVVPAEWLLSVDPVTAHLFFARLGEHELVQFEVASPTELGCGPIVLCVDGSSSMSEPHVGGYTRTMWAQALTLLLLRRAQTQRRAVDLVVFGGPGELTHLAFPAGVRFGAELLSAAASLFYGGGTAFEPPLRKAIALVEAGGGDADVVFISDGDCPTKPSVLNRFRDRMGASGARTWGVSLGHGNLPFTDRQWSVTDLLSGTRMIESLVLTHGG